LSKTALRSKIAQNVPLRHWLGFFVDMVDGVDVVGGGSHNFRAFAAARLGFPYNNTLKKSASSVSSADKIAVSSLLAFKPTFPLRFG